jgi:hypothetical protein
LSEDERQALLESETSQGGAFVAGVEQGATAGFIDEIRAGMKALGIGPDVLMAGLSGGLPAAVASAGKSAGVALQEQGIEGTAERYREERDKERAELARQEAAYPKTVTAGRVAGGLGSAAVPAGGVASVGKAIAAGAGYGAAAGLGESEADLTEGEFAEAATDTAIGGAIGAAAGGLGHGVAKVGGRAVNRLRGRDVNAERAAEKIARQVQKEGGELSEVGYEKTVRKFADDGEEVERRGTALLRKADPKAPAFHLTQAQKTGSPAEAMAEAYRRQSGKTMNKAQAAEALQLKQTGQILDMTVDGIAADPKMLGRSDVGKTVVDVIDAHQSGLRAERSRIAGPIYEAAEEAAGGSKIFATDNIQELSAKLADSDTFASSTKTLAGKVKDLSKLADDSGNVRYGAVKSFRTYWSDVLAGKEGLGKSVSPQKARHVARQMLEAIDADMVASGEGNAIAGKSALLLKQANTAWREMSGPIDDVATESVKKILKIDSNAGDTVVKKLLGESEDQIQGVFRVLNKADPATASQLRAQMFEEILIRGGKPSREGKLAKEFGATVVKPLTTLRLIVANETKLSAAFTGDTKAQLALRELMEHMQRIAHGPNLKGSPTEGYLEQALADGAGLVSGGAGSKATKGLFSAIRRIFTDPDAAGRAINDPELFNRAVRYVSGKEGKMSDQVARGLTASLAQLGIQSVEQDALDVAEKYSR